MGDIHLVKLCVGAESVEDLLGWEKARGEVYTIHTRNRPTRETELLDGGSLYWVIKGVILCRREIVSFTFNDSKANKESNGPQWLIGLRNKHIATEAQPKRPFQGWRYLKAEDAPRDIAPGYGEVSPELAKALKEAGVW